MKIPLTHHDLQKALREAMGYTTKPAPLCQACAYSRVKLHPQSEFGLMECTLNADFPLPIDTCGRCTHHTTINAPAA